MLIINNKYMQKITPVDYVNSQEQARDIAIEWQGWASEQSLSYGELAEYQTYFTTLANRFDLVDEFQENGII